MITINILIKAKAIRDNIPLVISRWTFCILARETFRLALCWYLFSFILIARQRWRLSFIRKQRFIYIDSHRLALPHNIVCCEIHARKYVERRVEFPSGGNVGKN